MDLRENKAMTPVESGFPITSITLDLTKRCVLACSYCFSKCFEKYDEDDLTPEMGRKIIDWLIAPSTRGDAKRVDISFWGGEPLMKWDLLKDLVLYAEGKAKEAGIEVGFGGTTNVVLLTPEKFDFMDEHRIRFLLSIDGIKEHHDRHRKFKNGKGSWEVVDRNATEILKRWPDSQVRFSYSVENLDGIMDDLNYLYDKGFRDIVYSPVSEGNWTDERKAKLIEMWDVISDWYIAKKKAGEPIRLKFLEDSCKSLHGQKRGAHAPCGAGRGYVGVGIDGSLWPCHRFQKMDDARPWYEKETCLGNIEYGILNHDWREKFIKWDATKDLPESCHKCEAYLLTCSGGCWATNYDINGDIRLVPHQSCVGELATIAQAKKAARELGRPYVDSLFGGTRRGRNQLPKVQGCQCYNVQDTLFGRMTVNQSEPYSCLCNMTTYGTKPDEVRECSCYNINDTSAGYLQKTADSSGASCRFFNKSPIEDTLMYLEGLASKLDKLTEEELAKIEKATELRQYCDAKRMELDELRSISESFLGGDINGKESKGQEEEVLSYPKYESDGRTVEAIQWTGEHHRDMYEFLTGTKDKPIEPDGKTFTIDHKAVQGGLVIKTKDCKMPAPIGSYIVRYSDMDFYPFEEETFLKKFKAIE